MAGKESLRFQAARNLIRRRQYKQALQELRTAKREELSAAERAEYSLLVAKALLETGQFDTENDLEFAIEYSLKNGDSEMFVRAEYLKARLMIVLGKHADARAILLDAHAISRIIGHDVWQAIILTALGNACYYLGDLALSVKYLEESVSVWSRLNNSINASFELSNLAISHCASGNLCESVRLFKQAVSNVSNWPNDKAVSLYLNSAVADALKGDFVAAKDALDKARPHFGEDVTLHVIYLENLGIVHLLEGDYVAAEAALLKALPLTPKKAAKSPMTTQVKRLLADACYGLGKYDAARDYAEEALDISRHINQPIEIAACYRVLARIACHDGELDKGYQLFQEAMDIFEQKGARYELALTQYLAATSVPDGNEARYALLFAAREYFRSEGVMSYVGKINVIMERDRETIQSVPRPAKGEAPTPIITASPIMKEILETARIVARTDASVLIRGPSGTGKEPLALYIHHFSERSGKLIAVNCSGIPESLFESELFGHEKGSYTGCEGTRTGKIEEADGGTLFLDEVGDLPLSQQPKTLRFLQSGEFYKVGSDTLIRVDCRIIAATNHDLETAMKEGRFRQDLYYRLNRIELTLPSLCRRPEDFGPLTEYFLSQEKVQATSKNDRRDVRRFIDALRRREWPGNVRELQWVISRLAILCRRDIGCMVEHAAHEPKDGGNRKELLMESLDKNDWNQREVGRDLAWSEGKVRFWMKKFGIHRPKTGEGRIGFV